MSQAIGLRVFLFLGDGSIRPVPQSLYRALLQGDKALPDCAGQDLRVAVVFVTIRQRRPHTLARLHTFWWTFDARGYVDQERLGLYHRQQLTRFDELLRRSLSPSLEDILPKRRAYSGSDYEWRPTDAELREIKQKIFPQGQSPPRLRVLRKDPDS